MLAPTDEKDGAIAQIIDFLRSRAPDLRAPPTTASMYPESTVSLKQK
jgi:hypothetical protein